jgi:hypothetical protein
VKRSFIFFWAAALLAGLSVAGPVAAQSDTINTDEMLEQLKRLEGYVNPSVVPPESDCPKMRSQIHYCGTPADWVEFKLRDGTVIPDYLQSPSTGILARVEQIDLPQNHNLNAKTIGALLRAEVARAFNVSSENINYQGSQPVTIRNTVFTSMAFSFVVNRQEKQTWLISYYLSPTRFFWIGNIQVTPADGEATQLLSDVHFSLMDDLRVEWWN